MDRTSLMNRRYSLNATQIINPIAESTCLTMNNTNSPKPFPWGGSQISPQNRSNSSICLTNSSACANQYGGHYNSSGNHNTNNTSCGHRCNTTRINSNKIDPRIYADVQSKGLASRIVKYHEKGTRLNRSLSVNNLYNKPGQFPVVHLNKQLLPCRAAKQNLSMTRIAPPEKSMFYGNTLSSILRSNSVVSMHKSDEEISRENRPILHPPPTESELAPTRSVLEVLKEISRKRINSDDLDTTDSTKKYCNRELNEPSNFVPPNKTLHVFQSHKRQREHFCNTQQKRHLPFNVPKQQHQPTTSCVQTHHSPEQVAKKRLCSNNNDITSSLSSSQYYANKRKLYDSKKAYESLSPTRTEYESNSTKRFQQEKEQASKLPTSNQTYNQVATTLQNRTVGEDSSRKTNNTSSSSAQCLSTVSETFNATRQNNSPQNNKQKLTLFNRNYDECKELVIENKVDDEYYGIPFVKPKKSISGLGTKNPIIERTQKSKLALMLSGLRGELQYDEDEVDFNKNSKEEKQTTNEMKLVPALDNTDFAKVITTTSSSASVTSKTNTITTTSSTISEKPASTTFTLPAVTTANLSEKPLPAIATISNVTANKLTTDSDDSKGAALPLKTLTKTQETTTSHSPTIKSTSPLVGIKLTPQTTNIPAITTASQAAAVQPTFGFNTVNSTVTTNANLMSTSQAPVPVLGGFSFNTPVKNGNIATTSTTSGGFNFGVIAAGANMINKTSALSSSMAPTQNLGASPPTFSFGVKTSNPTSLPTQTNKQNIIGSTSPATCVSLTGATTTISSLGSTQFSTTLATTAASPKTLEVTNNINAFAIRSKAAVVAPASTVTGGFSFGNATVAITVPAETSTSNSFSFGVSSAAKPSAIATPFSISTEQTLAPLGSNTFTFGSSPATAVKPAANMSNNFAFGSSAPVSSASTVSSNSFSFGANTQTKPAQFSFRCDANVASTPQVSAITPATTHTNNFAFGGDIVSASTGGAADKPLTGGFSFGSQNAQSSTRGTFGQPSATNIFGGSTPSSVETGIIKPSFSFGGATSSNSNAKSIFETSTSAVLNNKNSFASLANPKAANDMQNESFTFGADNNLATTMGATTNTKQDTTLGGGGGFAFNLDNKPGAFSFANSNINAPSNAATGNSNNATPFAFGAPSNTSSHTNDASKMANKTFSFNSNASNSLTTPTANLFSNVSAPGAGSSPFSFGSATNQTVQAPAAAAAAATNGNIFAPSPAAGNAVPGFGNRPIRRATRRLQKS